MRPIILLIHCNLQAHHLGFNLSKKTEKPLAHFEPWALLFYYSHRKCVVAKHLAKNSWCVSGFVCLQTALLCLVYKGWWQPCWRSLLMTTQRGMWLNTGSISFLVGTIKTSSRTRLAVCDRGFIEWPPCGQKLLPSVKIAFFLYNEFSLKFTILAFENIILGFYILERKWIDEEWLRYSCGLYTRRTQAAIHKLIFSLCCRLHYLHQFIPTSFYKCSVFLQTNHLAKISQLIQMIAFEKMYTP